MLNGPTYRYLNATTSVHAIFLCRSLWEIWRQIWLRYTPSTEPTSPTYRCEDSTLYVWISPSITSFPSSCLYRILPTYYCIFHFQYGPEPLTNEIYWDKFSPLSPPSPVSLFPSVWFSIQIFVCLFLVYSFMRTLVLNTAWANGNDDVIDTATQLFQNWMRFNQTWVMHIFWCVCVCWDQRWGKVWTHICIRVSVDALYIEMTQIKSHVIRAQNSEGMTGWTFETSQSVQVLGVACIQVLINFSSLQNCTNSSYLVALFDSLAVVTEVGCLSIWYKSQWTPLECHY